MIKENINFSILYANVKKEGGSHGYKTKIHLLCYREAVVLEKKLENNFDVFHVLNVVFCFFPLLLNYIEFYEF